MQSTGGIKTKKMKNFLQITVVFFLICTTTSLFVRPNGTDEPSCGGDQTKPCATISYSLSLLSARVNNSAAKQLLPLELLLLPGTYSGELNRNLVIHKSLQDQVYRITGLSFDRNDVVIDGGFVSPIIMNISENVEFYNITFANGRRDRGGCIQVISNSSVLISNCQFSGCHATEFGGAIFIFESIPSSSVMILHSHFVNNSASSGGAIYADYNMIKENSAIISSNFINNLATRDGGAIFTKGPSQILHTQISDNVAFNGGGVYLEGHWGSLDDNHITQNVAHLGGGVFISRPFSTVILNSNVSSNEALTGGGIFIQGPHDSKGLLEIMKTQISENNAEFEGGGIFVNGSISYSRDPSRYTISVEQSQIVNNKAKTTGGGIYVSASSIIFPASSITNNLVTNGNSSNLFCDQSTIDNGFCRVCCDVRACSECLSKGAGACVSKFKKTQFSCVGYSGSYCPCGSRGLILGVAVAVFVLFVVLAALIAILWFRFRRSKYISVDQ